MAMTSHSNNILRCAWAATGDALMQAYHDHEWGKPCHDDQQLFEFLCLEGQQAGLSWQTVLNKRAHYQQSFYEFNIQRVAEMCDAELDALLQDKGVIRHRKKLESIRTNARASLKIMEQHGSLDAYLWAFVGGQPIINRPQTPQDIPSQTTLSQQLSRALKKQGFSFVGPTTSYAFMQATGMVNDHLANCICAPLK